MKQGLHVNANRGILKCDQQGTYQSAGDVWCHPDAVTNILSFSLVKDLCHIACNNECKDAFIVHKPSGEQVRSINCGQGSCHMDPTLIGTTLINAAREMIGHFTPQQCTRAMTAHDLSCTLWFSLVCDMKVGMQTGIDDCPVTIQDINVAKTFFGKDICLLQKNLCGNNHQQSIQLHDHVPADKKTVQQDHSIC